MTSSVPLFDTRALARLNVELEEQEAAEIINWGLNESGVEDVAIVSSFQAEGTVILHLASMLRPGIPVLFLDTGYHFPETLRFKSELTARLDLNVIDLQRRQPEGARWDNLGPRPYDQDPDACCRMNKVEPLEEALGAFNIWVASLRRSSGPTRASVPVLAQYQLRPGQWIAKLHPLASWTRDDVWAYLRAHELPRSPLYEQNYVSIGCAPCTRPLQEAESDERAGRWAGSKKTECGIHAVTTS